MYKMYGITHDGKIHELSDNVKRDADKEKMNVQEYVFRYGQQHSEYKEVYYN